MDKIKVNKERDLLIIEKGDTKMIEANSNIYCGVCGNTVGITKYKVLVPFDSKQLVYSLYNCSLENRSIGFEHTNCNHTLFAFKNQIDLIPLSVYLKGE